MRNKRYLCAAGAQVQPEAPVRPSLLSTGARRAFFCRMKHSQVTGKYEDKSLLPSSSKKKGEFRLAEILFQHFYIVISHKMSIWSVLKHLSY